MGGAIMINMKKCILQTMMFLAIGNVGATSMLGASLIDEAKDYAIACKYLSYGDTVHFENSSYMNFPDIENRTNLKTVRSVDIPNGSALNFAASGIIGKTIRKASAFNDTPNPLGLTHSGFVINENPKRIFEKTLALMPDGRLHGLFADTLSRKAGEAIVKELMENHREVISAVRCPDVKACFSLESSGSAKEVLKGIFPHVHISDLSKSVDSYSGNVFIRPLNEPISTEQTMDFLMEYLGRSYESNFLELIKSAKALNREERTENIFCSELVALFYKKAGLIHQSILSNNVIPENFAYGRKGSDLLFGKAGMDIPLKISYIINDAENEADGCCGCLFRGLFSCSSTD
ncbi:MAG: hypothetical protein LBI95_03620 [Holosporales bacterium]|jgi:hypothetical protein|nr:hypothetical protein [Holosporales bacterium]